VSSTDTITIVLNKTPGGTTQHLRYAYTGTAPAACGTNNGQNYPRGNVRDSDSATSIDGDTLYDWLITFDEPVGFNWDPTTSASIYQGIFTGAAFK